MSFNISAQPKPMEWGLVELSDLEMSAYQPDSNAAAIILCKYGEAEFDFYLNLVVKVHTRIKILSEDGFSFGTVKLSYRKKPKDKAFEQNIDNIRGATYNLDDNGKIIVRELSKKEIFEEDIDGAWFRKRFTFPDLQVGSVIEYEYVLTSQTAHDLKEWSFQHSEPTLYSEFRAKIPEVYRYAQVYQGIQSFDINEVTPYSGQMIFFNYKGRSDTDRLLGQGGDPLSRNPTRFFSGNVHVNGQLFRWAMKDIPALRREPYVTTLENYRSKLRFQFAEIIPIYSQPIKVITTWDELTEALLESRDFGKQIQQFRILHKEAQKITRGITDTESKIEQIYQYLAENINWNGNYSVTTSKNLDAVFKEKSGNSAEINLMLVSMLRDVKLQAFPLITSTRSNGFIQALYPIISQFNHVLAVVYWDGKPIFLDATDRHRPRQLLPVEALNMFGYLLKKKAGKWEHLVSDKMYNRSLYLELELLTDGELRGKINCSSRDYAAYEMRKKLHNYQKKEEYIREIFFAEIANARIDSFQIQNENAYHEPLIEYIYFSVPDMAQISGDLLFLNPLITEMVVKNPFKLRNRSYPVDFAYGQKVAVTINLKVPEGYHIQDLPPPTAVQLPNKAGDFIYLSDAGDNTLSLRSTISIHKSVFEPTEYPILRQFFDRIVAAHDNRVVFKKITD